MAFAKRPVDVGTDVIEERTDTYPGRPDNMAYPGYVPQYRNPLITHMPHPVDQTPNHIDRGGYSHGTEMVLDGPEHPMPPKDQYVPAEIGGPVEVVYPEKDKQDQLEPVRVEIVNRDPIQRRGHKISTYFVGTPATTAAGTPTSNGLTPVRVLTYDPHRTRALIALSAVQGGSQPVILAGPTSSPTYGFPLPAATSTFVELFTDQELWVSGSATTDQFTVSVIVERTYNADPAHNVQ